MNKYMDLESRYCAHNYHPLPVVLTHGEGVYVWDDAGNKYLDMMSAYSAVSHGHAGPFLAKVCELTGQDMALPMNTGAEAVETAIKAARKWAYTIKGVEHDRAEIIACSGNFHGRTTTIIAMSDEPQYRAGFGPFAPGFKIIEYGNIDALEAAINENTAAFLVEPIQGEGGIIVPPQGYLKAAEALCRKHNVLLIADEIQTGLGRTGKLLACEHEDVLPDGLILGKALGGGIFPVSMFLARKDVMNVFKPGDHGSTFGGNPLGAAIGLEALNLLVEDRLAERSAELGDYLIAELQTIDSPFIRAIRGRGLFVGLEIEPSLGSARAVCEALMKRGLLSKETHETVVRLAPPLVIEKQDIDWALQQIREVLAEMDRVRLAS
jgi:ornithine--oxo-acid transaminase